VHIFIFSIYLLLENYIFIADLFINHFLINNNELEIVILKIGMKVNIIEYASNKPERINIYSEKNFQDISYL